MPAFDRPQAEQTLARLARLQPDTKPLWGRMNPPQLLGHLCMAVRYTMGEGPDLPFRGNLLSRNVFRHLILRGIVAIPKNVKLPRPQGAKAAAAPPEATLDDLRACLETYIERQTAGTLPSRVHPFFGPLRPAEWSRFHVAHFRHHLKQFGV